MAGTVNQTRGGAISGARSAWNFIDAYCQYADVLECDRVAHGFVAIGMLAAVLNGKVSIEYGSTSASLDVWLLLLSPSGTGRNALLKSARQILQRAELGDLIHEADFGSMQAFYQQVSEKSRGLFVWPEFSSVLAMLAGSRFGGLKQWITNLYDETTIPAPITYRRTGRQGQDTPPIEFKQAPRLNVIATSSLDWFTANLNITDTSGGFLPRWTIVKLRDTGKTLPKTGALDGQSETVLAQWLARAAKLEGKADLSEVEEMYGQWYLQAKARMSSPMQAPFFNRLRAQVLKFAVLREVSQTLQLKVSGEAMAKAIKLARLLEVTASQLLRVGITRDAGEVGKIEAFIQDAGSTGASRSGVIRECRWMKAYDLETHLGTLVKSGDVVSFRRKTTGRPAVILAHARFAEEHKQQFPEDESG